MPEQLAEKAELSRSYIIDVERGTHNISLDFLGKLIATLDITPIQLFELAGESDKEVNTSSVIKINT